jgi:hypothetical protein
MPSQELSEFFATIDLGYSTLGLQIGFCFDLKTLLEAFPGLEGPNRNQFEAQIKWLQESRVE